MVQPHDITIVTANRNMPENYLIPAIESIYQVLQRYPGLKFAITDDYSSPKYRKLLKKVYKKYFKNNSNAKLILLDKHYSQLGALYVSMTAFKTQYVLKHDSDDILFDLPDGFQNTNADFYVPSRFPLTREEWCIQPIDYNGGLVKRKLLKKLYKDYDRFYPLHKFLPEDLYALTKYFLYSKNISIQKFHKPNFQPIIHMDSQQNQRPKNGVTKFGQKKLILAFMYYFNPNFILEESPHYKTPLEFIDYVQQKIDQRRIQKGIPA